MMAVATRDLELLVATCRAVVRAATQRLAAEAASTATRVDMAALDREQAFAYDLAVAASRVAAAEELLAYAEKGPFELQLAAGFAGDVVADLAARVEGREGAWGLRGVPGWRQESLGRALAAARDPRLLEELAARIFEVGRPPDDLGDDLTMVRGTFRDFTRSKVVPVAARIHQDDADVPESIITELARMGTFGLSIPERYGGSAPGDSPDYLSMMVVTEELSRGSLGAAGSLVTRPEILAKALLAGGTEQQRRRWLPRIASGESMCAVAVTEPDHGSDVAGLETTAVPRGDFLALNGTKTWCTFAGRAELLLLLVRTGEREEGHRGLSLLVVEKPPYAGHDFVHHGEHGGRLRGRAIRTLGYRGMHSFELTLEDFSVPIENVVGGHDGLGRGFYLQMQAFANGRLQTAARALGLMQAALDESIAYTRTRVVFGSPLSVYQLTRAKVARMGYLIAACRQLSYRTAELLRAGNGDLEVSMAKSLACNAAEWVTREAQQLHGGMGYAEEFTVSRLFADARVLSIFEGADEVLALRVITRRLLERHTQAVTAV